MQIETILGRTIKNKNKKNLITRELTCYLKDAREYVIRKLFATFNHLNPVFDAIFTHCSNGTSHSSVFGCFEWMIKLHKNNNTNIHCELVIIM